MPHGATLRQEYSVRPLVLGWPRDVGVHEAHRHRPFTHRGGHPLGRPRSDIAGGEDARAGWSPAGMDLVQRSASARRRSRQARARLRSARSPFDPGRRSHGANGVRVRTDEEVQGIGGEGLLFTVRASGVHRTEMPVPFQAGDHCAGVDRHVLHPLHPVHQVAGHAGPEI